NEVVLFMKGTPQAPMCGFSGQIVQILDHIGVTYKGLNVLESDELRNGIKTYSNWPTFRSFTSRASSSAAATSYARCSRPANCSRCSRTRAWSPRKARRHKTGFLNSERGSGGCRAAANWQFLRSANAV